MFTFLASVYGNVSSFPCTSLIAMRTFLLLNLLSLLIYKFLPLGLPQILDTHHRRCFPSIVALKGDETP